MPKSPRPEVAFLLSATKATSDAVWFTAHLVTITPEGNVRNISGGWAGDPLFGLEDLVVSAQADVKGDGTYYAAKVEYKDIFAMSHAQAEAKVKVLRKIKRVFDAAGESMDWGRDIETTLALAAKALGVKRYLVDQGPDGSGRWGYDGRVHRANVTAQEAAEWASRRLADLRG